MIKRILNAEIHLYAVIAILLAVSAAAVMVTPKFFDNPIYNYTVYLPDSPNENSMPLQFGSWPALANSNFFKQVKDRFIGTRANFIEADLVTMQLTVYDQGQAVKQVPILTIGKPGSWWETPAGLYRVEDKQKVIYSSFAHVYSPWSLPFQGNFVIHGWPYYADGTPVASTYSGGCIRLSTEDAKALYDWASVGTPVLVFKPVPNKDLVRYSLKNPDLSADSYLAADLQNSFVFAGSSTAAVRPIASLTKLMTALTAVEYVNIENEITITADMLGPTSLPRLYVGEKLSLYNLLQPLLLESSNEAAVAIAHFLGPQQFVTRMNEKAKAIGMSHTVFTDPAGRQADNLSTAEDLFTLANYLANNRSFILKMTTGKLNDRTYGPSAFNNLQNFNIFHQDSGFVGGKVGESAAAKDTLLLIINRTVGDASRPIVLVLLGSEDYTADAQKLLNWLQTNYATTLLL